MIATLATLFEILKPSNIAYLSVTHDSISIQVRYDDLTHDQGENLQVFCSMNPMFKNAKYIGRGVILLSFRDNFTAMHALKKCINAMIKEKNDGN